MTRRSCQEIVLKSCSLLFSLSDSKVLFKSGEMAVFPDLMRQLKHTHLKYVCVVSTYLNCVLGAEDFIHILEKVLFQYKSHSRLMMYTEDCCLLPVFIRRFFYGCETVHQSHRSEPLL